MTKKIDNLLKRFDEEFGEKKKVNGSPGGGNTGSIVKLKKPLPTTYENIDSEDIERFLRSAIQEALEDVKDDKSLKDESNGRYNREIELRQKAREWGAELDK